MNGINVVLAKEARWRTQLTYNDCVGYVALATVATVPWSTSATSILVPIWGLMAAAAISWPDLRDELTRPRTALAVLLAGLGVAGMLWSEVGWAERINGVSSFARFFLLPLFAAYFWRSGLAVRALQTFLVSCSIILLISLVAVWLPAVTFWRPDYPIVPFKDATTQSLECALCAFGLISWVIEADAFTITSKTALAILLAALFLGDIIYVATSRTELVAIAVTVPILTIRRWKIRGLMSGVLAVIIISGAAWYSSANIQQRIRHGFWEYHRYESLDQGTSIGARLEFWRRSLLIMSRAPIFGHGTGSIEHTFATTASEGPQWVGPGHQVGTHVARTMVTPNPHNQTFAVGIQLGAVGIVVLYAMWLAQFWSFRGPGFSSTLGLVTITQFVIGSIFYSYLFDFTEAWLFIIGCAVLYAIREKESGVPSC